MKKQLSFQELRYHQKFEQILKAASKLFAKRGYENVSIEEIAAKVSLTKGSLYHYFRGKDEILFHIQKEAIDRANDVITEIIGSRNDPKTKLKQAIISHVKIVTQEWVTGALRQHELILPPRLRSKIVKARDSYENNFREIIMEGIDNGVFKTKNWKISVMAALGAMNGILKWYSNRGDLSVNEIGEVMSDFIISGFTER